MDKKKVKELVEQIDFIAHDYIDGDKQEELQNLVSELQEELSKSDWISVKDGLPEYDEDIWIRSKKYPKNVGTAYRHKECEGGYGSDKYGFPSELEVTHWHKIDKLEE
jgi:hypothetical protein